VDGFVNILSAPIVFSLSDGIIADVSPFDYVMQRYIRQIAFFGLGEAGQQMLVKSRVAVVGVGALGTVSANCLARAGIGFLRLIDKDYVERINLHRQIFFTEDDADKRVSKAVAACSFLARVNSEVRLEPKVAELNADSVESLFDNVDIVLDAVDNWKTRFIINEVCRRKSLPWIYCAALGSQGMTMNFLPNDQPCLQCVIPAHSVVGVQPTCVTEGVLNMTTGAIAAIQAAEAVKILIGSPYVRQGLFIADFWKNQFKIVPFERDANCVVCAAKS
jgi:adenylyltransferase/sulfurtransferase